MLKIMRKFKVNKNSIYLVSAHNATKKDVVSMFGEAKQICKSFLKDSVSFELHEISGFYADLWSNGVFILIKSDDCSYIIPLFQRMGTSDYVIEYYRPSQSHFGLNKTHDHHIVNVPLSMFDEQDEVQHINFRVIP